MKGTGMFADRLPDERNYDARNDLSRFDLPDRGSSNWSFDSY